MTDDYTPRTEQVRRYWQYGANAWRDEVARDDDTQADGTSIGDEFDRWLAQHDAGLLSPVRAAIDDLDDARAEGRICTYGQIQQALRKALP